VALEQVLSRMRYVEKRRPLLRKAFDENFGVKFRPLNMWEFFDEGIDSGRPRDIVKSINSERGYECFREIAIRAGNDWIKPAAPENVRQGDGGVEMIQAVGLDTPADPKRTVTNMEADRTHWNLLSHTAKHFNEYRMIRAIPVYYFDRAVSRCCRD
jgi:hypothetical protein